jgi:hypothetical protein
MSLAQSPPNMYFKLSVALMARHRRDIVTTVYSPSENISYHGGVVTKRLRHENKESL